MNSSRHGSSHAGARNETELKLVVIEVGSMPDRPAHRAVVSVAGIVLLSVVLQGCGGLHPASYTSPVPEDVRRSARTVAVVSTVAATDSAVPHLDVQIGKGKTAAAGAASGATLGLISGVAVTAAGGPLAVVLAPVVVPAFVLGSMAGSAAVGWSVAVTEEDAEAANAALSRARSDLSAEVARRIATRLPSVGKTPEPPGGTESADLRIEVAITRWGLAGGVGSDPLTGFFVEASYRVARWPDGATVVQRRFLEGGPQRPVSDWTRGNAALLSKAMDVTLSRVAEAVVDGAFRVHDFHVEKASVVRGLCGLKPVSPPSLFRFGPYESGAAQVASLLPRFTWEAFPARGDIADAAARILQRVSEIRYDLRVWKDEQGGAGDVVYERTGLVLPAKNSVVSHTLEMPLSAESSYLWSVRARFRLDGEERVTRWSHDREIDLARIPLDFFGRHPWLGSNDPYLPPQDRLTAARQCLDDSIPPLHYFRFGTP
jgi:hypothetical protein